MTIRSRSASYLRYAQNCTYHIADDGQLSVAVIHGLGCDEGRDLLCQVDLCRVRRTSVISLGGFTNRIDENVAIDDL